MENIVLRKLIPRSLLFILLGTTPFVASAGTDVADGYRCTAGVSPEKVIRAFIERGFVATKPYEIVDAIHEFAAKPGNTAFGLPLIAVVGWEENSAFFGRGPGTAPPVHFSFVVRANEWQLTNAVRHQGITVASRSYGGAYPNVRVQGFNSQVPDTLPPGTDPRFSYAQVVCSPRV